MGVRLAAADPAIRIPARGIAWPPGTVGAVVEVPDEELTRQALAADPDPPIPPDAIPLAIAPRSVGLLPAWYMPAPGRAEPSPRRVAVVITVIVALAVVNGAGLCVTYGFPEIAW